MAGGVAWRGVVLRGVATRGEAARVIYAAHLEDVLGHLQVGVHLGPAERVGLARTLTVGGRLHERLGKVVAEERLLLGVAVTVVLVDRVQAAVHSACVRLG